MDELPNFGEQRCGFAALIGAPNAGKSTLSNQISGGKISIVTHKVQTTRARIRAIAVKNSTQIILIDTPGIFEPKRKLDKAMVAAAWGGVDDCDITLVIIDAAKGLNDENRNILKKLDKNNAKNIWLVLNKIDLIKNEKLLAISAEFNEFFPFEHSFMISADRGHGVKQLVSKLEMAMPLSVWLYPEDQMADIPTRLLAAELTREKLFLKLHDELPYSLTVETEKWTEQKDGSVRVEQVIYVQRNSQKKIVLGHKGEMIKNIGQKSRLELAEILGQKVHLFLFVKVRDNWMNDPERLRQMGLDV
ncbi:MAG: GTPase Era [Rhizobiales bacterium]|nr:GTPase Era [Hyphomicrobiales bacterium]NRB14817.1 GTPase Era [Hyphomicrobiales bacterium]